MKSVNNETVEKNVTTVTAILPNFADRNSSEKNPVTETVRKVIYGLPYI